MNFADRSNLVNNMLLNVSFRTNATNWYQQTKFAPVNEGLKDTFTGILKKEPSETLHFSF